MLINDGEPGQQSTGILPTIAKNQTMMRVIDMNNYTHEPTRNNSITDLGAGGGTQAHLKYKRKNDEFQDRQLMKKLQKKYLEEQMRIKNEAKMKENLDKRLELQQVNSKYEEHMK